MQITKLRRIGDSVMIAVPPAILDRLQLREGATVGLAVDGDCLIVDPQMRPHYTLEELLAQCDPNVPMSEEDREWIDAPCVGRELI